MSRQPHWLTSTTPDRPFWQEFLLMIFAPWVRQRWFSFWERLLIGGLVWAIILSNGAGIYFTIQK